MIQKETSVLMIQKEISVEVLTPVHVGMGREKDWINGLDFIYKKGEYIIFNQSKMLGSLPQAEVKAMSGMLADGKFTEFAEYVQRKSGNLKNAVLYTAECNFECRNVIKRTYQDALGNYAIPGSSVKGALRSILLTALYRQNGGRYAQDILLGNIENNLMRFVQVTDCRIDTTPSIYPVKIFCADTVKGQKVGQWKDRRDGGHNEQFNTSNFVSFYEMLPFESTGKLRISWGPAPLLKNRRSENIPNLNRVFNEKGIDWLFQEIRRHTKAYLEREIHFFETYPNHVLQESNLMDDMQWLLEQNSEPGACLLRVGANVGYHSITGDWKFRDHTRTGIDDRSGAIKYKTRKLIFIHDKHDWLFYLPGFIKLKLHA